MGEPVVVRTGDRHRSVGVGDPPEAEPDRGVQDGDVDPFGVHVDEPRHGSKAPARACSSGNGCSGAGADVGAGRAHLPELGDEDLVVADEHVVEATRVGLDARPDRVVETRPRGTRFEHVAVGIDHQVRHAARLLVARGQRQFRHPAIMSRGVRSADVEVR